MYKLLLAAATVIMLVLLIKDAPVTKKIWAVVTAVISLVAAAYMIYVYFAYDSKLGSVEMEAEMRAKWQADFVAFVICVIILLIMVAVIIGLGYYKIRTNKDAADIDSFFEYIVIGISAVIAVVIYIIGTTFALMHTSKTFDISYFSIAFSACADGIIIINSLLYMKIIQ